MLISQDTGIREFYWGDEHYIYTDGEKELGNLMLIVEDAVVKIWDVKIAGKYRNQKYGTRMMTEVIERIKKNHPDKKIKLDVRASNDIAIHLYKKLGFIISEVDPTGLSYCMELKG